MRSTGQSHSGQQYTDYFSFMGLELQSQIKTCFYDNTVVDCNMDYAKLKNCDCESCVFTDLTALKASPPEAVTQLK